MKKCTVCSTVQSNVNMQCNQYNPNKQQKCGGPLYTIRSDKVIKNNK